MNLKSPLRLIPLLGSIAFAIPALGVDIVKLNNTTALNLAGAWSGSVVPGVNDVMVWNSSFTAVAPRTVGALSSLGGSLSIGGIKVTNASSTANAASTAVGFQDAGSTNTLTIGAGGFDLSAATQAFYLESRVLLSANQNWVINNANTNANPTGFGNGEDLAFRAMAGSTTAATTAFNLGGNTVTTSGTGQVTVSSGYAMTNGTINVGNSLFLIGGGDSRLTTVGSDVNLNVASGSILHFQSNSGAVTSSAAITLNGGTLKLVNNNAANPVTINNTTNVASASTLLVGNNVGNGSVASTPGIQFNANLTGSGALALTNNASSASVLHFNGDNSAYSGSITIGGTAGRIVRMNTATAGSGLANWTVNTGLILQVNGVTVSLGTLNGAGTITNSSTTSPATLLVGGGSLSGTITNGTQVTNVTKTGNGVLTLSGANSYTGSTLVSGGSLVVAPGTLNGTAVTVANSASLVAQSATSGTLNANVTVSSGGSIVGRVLAAGTTVSLPALDLNSNGLYTVETGLLGNPTAAPISATTLTTGVGGIIKITGGALVPGTFPVLSYSTIAGAGFGGLSLSLPFRVGGSLIDNPSSVDVQITGISKPVWSGTLSGTWDVDTVGNGTQGTANWTATSGPNTYVESPTLGADTVTFNDAATGTTAVTLAIPVAPNGVNFENVAKAYTLTGAGKITGTSSLSKSGAGNVTIANSGTNDYSGGTIISDGRLLLGDGVSAASGTLGSGTIAINTPGILELNRPDDFAMANSISGTGVVKKSQPNTATLSAAATMSGGLEIAGGSLRFTAGGNLSGVVSGSGSLVAAGGTLELSGSSANTFTGLTTVSAGTLRLNKTGVNAIAGNLYFIGTGGLTLAQANQIDDAATVTYDKAANGGTVIFNETIGALNIVNGADAAAQVQGNNGFNVAGLLTAQNTSVFAMGSGHSGSVGGLALSGTPIIRIAANSAASSLSVGAQGITASGGTIQIGQGTGAFDAVLNLDGNVTTTGNLSFTDGAFTGANLRQLNIGATDRIFTIGAGTTTTIAPDIVGTAGITKRGNGTLQLTAASASNYSGITYVEAGTFITTPSHTAGSIFVNPSATFGVALSSSNTTFIAAEIGTDPGAILQLGLGPLGNPVAPVINANTLTIGGATTIRVVGTNLTSATEIPLIAYGSMTGPVGFGDLSLVLPPRIAGSLVDNTPNSRIDLSINGIDQIKWTGAVNGNWDIDADTTGSTGTLNWKTTISATAARYFQGSVATDTANFDDSATGTRVVNLTTNLTPVAVNVDNSAGDYTFSGTGKLTGATSLNKSGTGTLILANSAAYDHTGGTTINAGTLQIGDGTSNSVGYLPTGAISNNGTLIFNTVDDVTVAQAIGGTGTIVKNNANLLAFTAAATNAHNYTVNAGNLRFNGAATLSGNITIATGALTLNAGGTLSGAITGTGTLNSLAGTLQLNGGVANTFTGLTTVAGGTLQLAKAANTTAVGGDITVTGAGIVVVLSPEQIPDTATLRFLGTSADPMVGTTGIETVANVLLNPSVSTGQLVMRAGFTVTNLATVQNGILGVGSGSTATLNAVNMGTGTILRIAGNSAASTLNIGPGGITASGGEIQIKFNTNPQDAVLNLGGNFIATGNVAITNAGYNGTNLNVIDLGAADRTFEIADSTTTTVAPDITSTGGALIKTGNGTLQLTDLSIATYTGITDIVAGTLDLRGAISGTSGVNVTGTLTGNGGITVASAGNISINAGGKLSPGFTNGTLTAGLSGGGQFNIAGAATSVTPSFNFELDTPFSSDKVTLVGGALNIGSGVLDFSDFNFAMLSAVVPDTDYVLFDGDTPIVGTLSSNIAGDIGGYTSTLQIGDNGNDLILHIPEPGSAVLLLGGLAMLAGRRRSRKE